MKITLLVVGKTTDSHIQALLQDYQKRLGHYIPFCAVQLHPVHMDLPVLAAIVAARHLQG